LKERDEPKGRKTLRVAKKESQEHLNIAAIFQPSSKAKRGVVKGDRWGLGTRKRRLLGSSWDTFPKQEALKA